MTEVMISKWNSVVKPEDTVKYLGDFSLSKAALIYVSQLNGIKDLIAGNHDHTHPAHAKKPDRIKRMTEQYLEAGFNSVKLEDEVQIGSHRVVLHHMPYSGDHGKERYAQYRPKDNGLYLLHGHVHEKWKVRGKMINVGVDVWDFFPVSQTQIEGILK